MKYNYRIMMLFDAHNCLPPAHGKTGRPIVRECDGRGIVTSAAIKVRIKERLLEKGEQILHHDYGDDYTIFKQLKAYDKSVNPVEEAKKYLDVRLFGALDMANKIAIKIPGPVTVTEAETIDPIITNQLICNRTYMVDVNDDGSNNGSRFGNVKEIVEYGLYRAFWGIDNIRAQNANTTDEDVEKMIDAIVHIWDHDYGASRQIGTMLIRKVIVWKWEDDKNESNDTQRMNSVIITKKDGIDVPSGYDDYTIEITDPNAIVVY